MKIVVLSNSLVSEPLITWLRQQNEDIVVINEEVSLEQLIEIKPSLIICYDYSFLLKDNIIDAFDQSIINLHLSYLPWNRGTDSYIWALIDNTPRGITIHLIDKGISTGDILVQEELVFNDAIDTPASAFAKHHEEMLEMFKVNWKYLKEKRIIPTKQKKGGTAHNSADLDKYRVVLEKAAHMPIKAFRRLCQELK